MPLFSLAQIGLDHTEQALCETVLSLAGGIEIGNWTLSDEVSTADLVVISAEREVAIESLLDSQRDSGRPRLAILGEAEGHGDLPKLKRPLSYTGLISLLKQVEAELGEDTHSFDDWSQRFYHPKTAGSPGDGTKALRDDSPPLPSSEVDSSSADTKDSMQTSETSAPSPMVRDTSKAETAGVPLSPSDESAIASPNLMALASAELHTTVNLAQSNNEDNDSDNSDETRKSRPTKEHATAASEIASPEQDDSSDPVNGKPLTNQADSFAAEPASIFIADPAHLEGPDSATTSETLPTLEVAIDDIEIIDSLLLRSTGEQSLENVVLAVDLEEIRRRTSAIKLLESLPPPSALPERPIKQQTRKEDPDDTRLARVIPMPLPHSDNPNNESRHSLDPNTTKKIAVKHRHRKQGDLFRPARRFVPKLRLLGIINEIVANGGSFRLSHDSFGEILVWPRPGVYQATFDLGRHPELFRRPWSEFRLSPLNQHPPPENLLPLIKLRFLAALHGSEGKLLLGADPQAMLQLHTLPDCKLFDCSQEHQRLARYLYDFPTTLGGLATATQLPIATVIDFVNACRESGLIRDGKTTPTPSQTDTPQQRGRLMRRLLQGWQHLRGQHKG